MNTKVETKIQEYTENFNKLVEQRQDLLNKVADINVAMEQIRGAVNALQSLEVSEDKPKTKKEK